MGKEKKIPYILALLKSNNLKPHSWMIAVVKFRKVSSIIHTFPKALQQCMTILSSIHAKAIGDRQKQNLSASNYSFQSGKQTMRHDQLGILQNAADTESQTPSLNRGQELFFRGQLSKPAKLGTQFYLIQPLASNSVF